MSESVARQLACRLSEPPRAAMTSMAWAAAGIPSPAATPADITTWPFWISSSTAQPNRFASIILQMASAIGLRQVFPVQTNSQIVPAIAAISSSVMIPARSIIHRSSLIETTVGPRLTGPLPSSIIMSIFSISIRGLSVPAASPRGVTSSMEATGPGVKRRISRSNPSGGTRRATRSS
jgi:hypothetical protein